MDFFAHQEMLKLISRKIWMIEKSWNFHTICSLTSDFFNDLRWWIRQSIPVKAAPIKNEAKEIATAISAGTPTMTTWDECNPGDSWWGGNSSNFLLCFWASWGRLGESNLTSSLWSVTYSGPLLDSCWAAGPTCHSSLSSAHFCVGSTHWWKKKLKF